MMRVKHFVSSKLRIHACGERVGEGVREKEDAAKKENKMEFMFILTHERM